MRKLTQRLAGAKKDDIDDFLSSDLELSFASTVSIHSPPRDSVALSPESEFEDSFAMDISPAIPRNLPSFRENNNLSVKPTTRPRALTSGARLFGRDVSNDSLSVPAPSSIKSNSSQGKRTQRSALPMEWMQYNYGQPAAAEPPATAPSSPDAMDVDTSFNMGTVPAADPLSSPAPLSAAPTIKGFNTLFFESMSPSRDESPARLPKKRRSTSPVPSLGRRRADTIDSSPAPVSPSLLKLERLTKPMLSGLGEPSLGKRPRRPAFSAMVPPSQSSRSAHPSQDQENQPPKARLPPPRRAFSAMLPPNGFENSFSEESSFENSSPAQSYAKRQHVKTIRRCDGTDDFRPLTGATAMMMRDHDESPRTRAISQAMGNNLGGFGDNEAHGKILPCHRVREDGLMRINPQTLDMLLDGHFNSQIANFHVIDCRFDYEYNGGHIPGAVNINNTANLEEYLLSANVNKPVPSMSGEGAAKTILVFHCEFSVKRAPTFAKHLRSKDRALNNHNYPRIHYPEVYVLEGGYCQYYKESSTRCEPKGYVRMDDPHHAASRKEDLDQFRKGKFGRTKSYAYGEAMGLGSAGLQQSKRNTAPSGGPTQLFAAANAARTRRGGVGLGALPEDGHATQSEDEETDLGDSPCPPPNKNNMLKGRKLGRGPLIRAETYGPSRFGGY
ncbi:hypothetical protein DENSPDRAFT_775853 [Dentipellis sp. KUC8613]|nr:hypothetical protein DENSPDRAFT_775853 [Dentipellis sp. KUC8613]